MIKLFSARTCESKCSRWAQYLDAGGPEFDRRIVASEIARDIDLVALLGKFSSGSEVVPHLRILRGVGIDEYPSNDEALVEEERRETGNVVRISVGNDDEIDVCDTARE